MSKLYIYDYRSPLDDLVPDYLTDDFTYAYFVIQEMLGEYPEADLVQASYLLDLKASEFLNYLPHPDEWAEGNDLNIGYASGAHDLFIRYLGRQKVDVTELFGLPGLTWPKCYVLAAMAILSYAYREQLLMEQSEYEPIEIMGEMAKYAVECSKYISYAVALSGKLTDARLVEHQLREIGSKGGKRKAEKIEPFKQKALSIARDEYAWKTARQAAKSVWKRLEDENEYTRGSYYLSSEEPDKTIARWITQDRKKIES